MTKKLPLVAIPVMSGHDSRRGYFNHARSMFYGNATYEHLPKLLFLWMDEVINKVWNTYNHASFGFLALLKKNDA